MTQFLRRPIYSVTIEKDHYWTTATCARDDYPEHKDDGGKWLVFVKKDQAQDWFDLLLAALARGDLGDEIKMATSAERPTSTSKSDVVICVYTYSLSDEKDVKRVRQSLRMLGIAGKIPYKTDAATHARRYKAFGSKHISALYE